MFVKIGKPIHIVSFMFLILVLAAPKIADADMCCPTRDANGKRLNLYLYDPPDGDYAYCCTDAKHCPYSSKCGDGTNNTCGPYCAITTDKAVGLVPGAQCYRDSRTPACSKTSGSVNSSSEVSFSASWSPVLAQPSPQDLVAVPDGGLSCRP